MVPVSIVIITQNEAEVIADCINAAKLITDDIVIVDNDSTDATRDIAWQSGCNVYQENWDGYGANKNKGLSFARYDWILSIDADEVADEELIRALHELKLENEAVVYDIDFRSYYGKKPINFGTWGRDHHIRLFNRKLVKWSEPLVHETLILPKRIAIKKLDGHLHHYSIRDKQEYINKNKHYAELSAGKYQVTGRKATLVKLYLAPLFHFIKNYIVFLGFLDGREGWMISRMIAKHTRLKYRLLKQNAGRIYQEKEKVQEKVLSLQS